MIEIRHLRSFLAVAEHLHFGRAAARLHLTQPPLTRQIQQLERELGGVRLFDRTQRRVALTEAGASFVEDARALLESLDRAADRTRRVARGEAGRLRVGFISTADYSVLPPLLKEFKRSRPAVDIELLELTGDEQLRRLDEGSLDVGILIPAESDAPRGRSHRARAALSWMPLIRETLVAVVPRPGRLARRRGPLPVRALRDEPFVSFPRALAPALHDEIAAYLGRAGLHPEIAQRARQMQTIIGLVAGGLGVAVVPSSMQQLRRPDVAYKALTPRPPPVTTQLARTSRPSAVVDAFVDVARGFQSLRAR